MNYILDLQIHFSRKGNGTFRSLPDILLPYTNIAQNLSMVYACIRIRWEKLATPFHAKGSNGDDDDDDIHV